MTWPARTHIVTTGSKDSRGNPHATDSALIVEGQLLGSQTDPGAALPDLVGVAVAQVSRTNRVHTRDVRYSAIANRPHCATVAIHRLVGRGYGVQTTAADNHAGTVTCSREVALFSACGRHLVEHHTISGRCCDLWCLLRSSYH